MMRRTLLTVLLALLLFSPAHATWSIVVVNRRTGEVAVGSATCIPRINLLVGLPTLVPGIGAGVVQSAGDSADLVPMTVGLRAGLDPADIMLLVRAAEPRPGILQSGVVALYPGVPVTFSGGGVGRAKLGVTGEVGDLAYAIQGNVLSGANVIRAARAALLSAPGDLGQKLLAAMQAAREAGGDGRCSCEFFDATGCGSPPPDFTKSAHVGFLALARIGDEAPPCVTGEDCANTPFHLRLSIFGRNANMGSPDPVDQLAERYALWRAARSGRPDGILSSVVAVDSLPADGITRRSVVVQLVDIDGVPLTHGRTQVSVRSLDDVRLNVDLGRVKNLGDGRYRFMLSASDRVGTDRLVITAEDELVRATLYPYLEIRSTPPAPLSVGRSSLSASEGGEVPFVLSDPDFAGAYYLLLASASGTSPGTRVGRAGILPLVRDRIFLQSMIFAGDPALLPGTRGTLSASGRAEAALVVAPGVLAPLIGRRLSWAAILASPRQATTTEAVGFDVLP